MAYALMRESQRYSPRATRQDQPCEATLEARETSVNLRPGGRRQNA